MTQSIDKDRLVDFVFDAFDTAELFGADGLNGEAAGIRLILERLGREFGISEAAMDVAQQIARENAELRERVLGGWQ